MVDSVYMYIVKSTWAFIGSFQYFEDMLQTYWRCAWRSLMQKKYFLTNSMKGVSSKSYLLPSFIAMSRSNELASDKQIKKHKKNWKKWMKLKVEG